MAKRKPENQAEAKTHKKRILTPVNSIRKPGGSVQTVEKPVTLARNADSEPTKRPQRTVVVQRQENADHEALKKKHKAQEKQLHQLQRHVRAQPPLPDPDIHIGAARHQDAESEADSDGNDDRGFTSNTTQLGTLTVVNKDPFEIDPKLLRRAANTKQKSLPAVRHNTADSQATSQLPQIPSNTSPGPSNSQQPDSIPVAVVESRLPTLNSVIRGKVCKPNISDYGYPDCTVILTAVKKYEARVVGENPFPPPAESSVWAEDSFKKACEEHGEDIKLTDPVERLIKGKASRVRNEVLCIARDVIPSFYGFSQDGTKKSAKKNRELYKDVEKLYPWKDRDTLAGFMESDGMMLIFRKWAFVNGHKPGTLYATLFDPISIHSLAFFKQLTKYVLDEWQTGIYIRGPDFTEKSYSKEYKEHLEVVMNWTKINHSVTEVIRRDFFKRARKPFREKKGSTTHSLNTKMVNAIKADLETRVTSGGKASADGSDSDSSSGSESDSSNDADAAMDDEMHAESFGNQVDEEQSNQEGEGESPDDGQEIDEQDIVDPSKLGLPLLVDEQDNPILDSGGFKVYIDEADGCRFYVNANGCQVGCEGDDTLA